MKQRKQVNTTWSPDLAYIVGIIVTDGNLSKDGRHIILTSKDKNLLEDIRTSLVLKNIIGKRINAETNKQYYVLQIGDKNFYTFLESIGITPAKSKTIQEILVPKEYFSDFLRGCIDGDGNIDIFMHKESLQKQLRIRIASASRKFLLWLFETIKIHVLVEGGWIFSPKNKSWQVLTYGKKDSIKILHFIYDKKTIYLKRKFAQAKYFL